MSVAQHDRLTGGLLREVSRSFYLTLRVLPQEIRPQIALAYLLARASDTIADTRTVARDRRLDLLREFQKSVGALGKSDGSQAPAGPVLPELAERQALPAEKLLLERLPECFRAAASFPAADRARIAELLQTIVTGQIFDLERFPGESDRDLTGLADDAELDRYTYLVAGCVGEFWTRICVGHLDGLEGWKDGRMDGLGVRFGKGLQLVNVLRDIPKDLRIGRSYLPVADPRALLDPRNYESIRPLYQRWLDTAVAHLEAGWQYTMKIPARQWRLRLACIWPIWIGLKTIARLRHANPLDPSRRIKITRAEVYRLMARSVLTARNDGALQRQYARLKARATP